MTCDFRIRGYAGHRHPREIPRGTLIGETTHRTAASAAIEIDVWQARMLRGEVSHVELIDCRPGGTLTDLNVRPETKIAWSF